MEEMPITGCTAKLTLTRSIASEASHPASSPIHALSSPPTVGSEVTREMFGHRFAYAIDRSTNLISANPIKCVKVE